jgi:hypothetical protein
MKRKDRIAIVLGTVNRPKKARWRDITHETFREYKFPGGETVRVETPKSLAVVRYGHRLLDARGVKYDIPFGWYVMERGTKCETSTSSDCVTGFDVGKNTKDADTWKEGGGSKGDVDLGKDKSFTKDEL